MKGRAISTQPRFRPSFPSCARPTIPASTRRVNGTSLRKSRPQARASPAAGAAFFPACADDLEVRCGASCAATFSLCHERRSDRALVRSLPPCGGGLGRGVSHWRWMSRIPPSPPLPHKGGESRPLSRRGSASRPRLFLANRSAARYQVRTVQAVAFAGLARRNSSVGRARHS